MRLLRTASTVLTALLFVGVVTFWIFHVPGRPNAIYDSIPAGADMVSVHHNLAGRLAELMENEIFSSVLAATGLTADRVESMANDPDTRVWLDRIASDESVLARIPAGPFSNNSSWCLAAWIGSESVRLRWSIGISASKDSHIGSVAGTHIWRFALPDLPPDRRLYCAVEEGVLLAALSDSPDAIHRMVLTYQGRNTSAAEANPEWSPPETADLQIRPDQFWAFTGFESPAAFNLQFGEISRLRMRGLIGIPGKNTPTAEPDEDDDRPQILEWEEPMLQAMLNPGTVRELAAKFSDSPVARLILDISTQLQSGPLFIGLLDGENQGRLKGFRIPGALLAMPVDNETRAVELMLAKLDQLNAIYSLGVIYRRVQIADTAIYYIEGSRDNLYGELPPAEQIAFMVNRGFLLIGSHSVLLERIAADRMLEGASPVWNSLALPRPDNYIWLDLERSAKALRLALAVYSLKMSTEHPSEAREIRERIKVAGEWMEAFVPYRNAIIWGPSIRTDRFYRFDIGGD